MDLFKNAFSKFFLPSALQPKTEDKPPLPVNDRRSEIPPNREVLLAWEAPLRNQNSKPPEFYKKIVSLLFVIGLLLIVAGQFFLLILLISLTALFYVLSSVPSERAKHEIDNYGVFYLGGQYFTEEFKYFFFSKEGQYDVLNIDTKDIYPGRLIMLLEGVTLEQVKNILGSRMSFKEAPPTTVFDKALKNASSKLSLD